MLVNFSIRAWPNLISHILFVCCSVLLFMDVAWDVAAFLKQGVLRPNSMRRITLRDGRKSKFTAQKQNY